MNIRETQMYITDFILGRENRRKITYPNSLKGSIHHQLASNILDNLNEKLKQKQIINDLEKEEMVDDMVEQLVSIFVSASVHHVDLQTELITFLNLMSEVSFEAS